MTMYHNPTTYPFPWSFFKVNKSKTKNPKKVEGEIQEKHTPTCIEKSNRVIKNPTPQKCSPHLKLSPFEISSQSKIVSPSDRRKHTTENLLHLSCSAPTFSLFSFASFLSLFLCLLSQQATRHLQCIYIYIYNIIIIIKTNLKISYMFISLNKLKSLFLNLSSVIINYTQLIIFYLTKNIIIFII